MNILVNLFKLKTQIERSSISMSKNDPKITKLDKYDVDARPFKIQDKLIGKDESLYRGEQLPFEHLTKLLLSSIKRIEAKRVVIDSQFWQCNTMISFTCVKDFKVWFKP